MSFVVVLRGEHLEKSHTCPWFYSPPRREKQRGGDEKICVTLKKTSEKSCLLQILLKSSTLKKRRCYCLKKALTDAANHML